ncbi:hypothetical protein ACWEQL_30060 [Kitasatospora sp. NPDC004240]
MPLTRSDLAVDELFEPAIRRIFRRVATDRFHGGRATGRGRGAMPPQAELLFGPADGVWASEREFLGEFHNGIHHQDTSDRLTARGVPLLAALAVDDRVPDRERTGLVIALFHIATEADRHTAEYWPHRHPRADATAAADARAAVRAHLGELTARWDVECPTVRLALAALAAATPDPAVHAATLPRLHDLAAHHPAATPVGRYLRYTALLISGPEPRIAATVEELTAAHWRGTAREVPAAARAVHLLDQLLARLSVELLPRHGPDAL